MNQRHIDRLVQERRNSIVLCTSSKEHVCILIKILLNIVLKCGPMGNTLTEPMMTKISDDLWHHQTAITVSS